MGLKPRGVVAGEAAAFLRGDYPSFIYRRRCPDLDAGYIPVFAFHSIDPADFDRKLRYLDANGYATVLMDEVTSTLAGKGTLPPRPVALTIDDGRLSTWSAAYPLLRRYGMRATAFVIPGYLGEGDPRPTEVDRIDVAEDRDSVLRWSEVVALHESGVIGIESHSMLHRAVPVSSRSVGFVTPRLASPLFLIQLSLEARERWTRTALQARLGMPLYEQAQVLSVGEMIPPDPEASQACIERVRLEGGEEFFRRAGWKRTLEAELARFGPVPDPVDTASCQRWEIEESKRILEHNLGSAVRHLCFPQGAGSERAIQLAKDAGFESCVWTLLPSSSTNRPGSDPYRVGRIKHDYVYRLPGKGRRSLVRIVGAKVVRRLGGDTGY